MKTTAMKAISHFRLDDHPPELDEQQGDLAGGAARLLERAADRRRSA